MPSAISRIGQKRGWPLVQTLVSAASSRATLCRPDRS